MTNLSTARGCVVISRLSKSYGRLSALRSIDLVIAPGETVALLGPNGAGKTTMIDMILGLVRPDSGRISLSGMSPLRAGKAGVVGGMLQTGSLLPHLSVRELVTLVASMYPRPTEVEEVLRQTRTLELSERRTTKLSQGQIQRVRFAVALVGNPALLLLDEPTVALDVEARRDFWSAVESVVEAGKTVIFSTHYLEEADAYADRIVLLAHGEIVADGPATEIKARVGGRTIRATLPGAGLLELSATPGVISADRRGDAVILYCSDPETALRALLDRFPSVHDIEVKGAGLEDAFLALTSDQSPSRAERS